MESFYQDSVILMAIAAKVRLLPGVRQAGAFMGTPANQGILEQIGMSTEAGRKAGPNDLIITIDADNKDDAEAALARVRELILERRRAIEASTEVKPRTIDSALRSMPDANLACISVPGAYAKFEALRALRRGLHIFLFSDNIALADEIELKQQALQRGLLCMGPDCGTAYLNGTGLGFANRVPTGPIGCVAASGTGLQAVVSRVAMLGEGISHGIGVGGRDLAAELAGAMTFYALEKLAADAKTEVIVLISKPPDPAVTPQLQTVLEKIKKPVIACCLGASVSEGGKTVWVPTLDAAADAAVAVLHGREWSPQNFNDPEAVRKHLAAAPMQSPSGVGTVMGLYTGGTLAAEAHLILEPLLGRVAYNQVGDPENTSHRILDLGADEFTVGRPHPMIDPQKRVEFILQAGISSAVDIILLDLVLGKASHPDPAQPLADAFKEARVRAEAGGRHIRAVAAIVGTSLDPQDVESQATKLQDAGIELFPTNAEATRFAALLAKPELSDTMLGEKQ
jgi:FdrA protein